MTSVNVTTTKNTVTVNGETRVVTVKTQGPQGPSLPDGDKGDVTVSSNGTAISINNNAITSAKIADGAIVNADINASAAIALSKLATGALPTAITVTSANISDLSIVNADINASAAIAGTKISPDFGSQTIATTGVTNLSGELRANGNIKMTNDSPKITFVDSQDNPDFEIGNLNGIFRIRDTTNSANRLVVNTDGHVDVTGNLDVGANISVTGTVDGRDVATDGTKLDGIETGATADQTASEILTLLKTVDGAGSGLNADTLDGLTSDSFLRADTSDTTVGNLTISSAQPQIFLTDTNNNSDYKVQNANGTFAIRDETNTTNRFRIFSNGTVDITNNLDVGQGVDVTGNITVTGTVDGVDIATRDTLFGGLTSSSGVLTNGVTATTQSASDNSTKVATTAYTDTAIANLVDSAPGTLNTLNELAAALGDDANFSTTVTNSIATKLPLAGGTLTGLLTIENANPAINFTDNNNNPDYQIGNLNGVFRVRDTTNSANRIVVNTDGHVDILGNLDVGAGIDVTGAITATSSISVPDNVSIFIGTGNDLSLKHDGSNSFLTNATGYLLVNSTGGDNVIRSSNDVYLQPAGGEFGVKATANAATELYFDNSKKVETTSSGVKISGTLLDINTTSANSAIVKLQTNVNSCEIEGRVVGGENHLILSANNSVDSLKITGAADGKVQLPNDDQKLQIGASQDLELYHDGSNSYIDETGTGGLYIRVAGTANNGFYKYASNESLATFQPDNAVRLYYDNSKKFETTSSGIDVDGSITCDDIVTAGALLHEGDTNTLVHFSAEDTIELKTHGFSRLLVNNSGVNLVNGYFNTNGNRIILGDSSGSSDDRLVFGNDNDLEVYHDGTQSYIKNATGNLDIITGSTSIDLQGNDGSETLAKFQPNGTVELYYDNSKKLETTTYGAKVTDFLNVGKTDTPSKALELYQASNAALRIQNSSTGVGGSDGLLLEQSGLNTLLVNYEAGNIDFKTANNTRLLITSDGNVQIPNDTGKLQIGASQDVQLFHDGGNTHFANTTGTFKIKGDDIHLQNASGSEDYITAAANGNVELFFDNSKKFETVSAGCKFAHNIEIQTSGTKGIIHTGYNVIEQRFDTSNYDTIKWKNNAGTVDYCRIGVETAGGNPATGGQLRLEGQGSVGNILFRTGNANNYFLNSSGDLILDGDNRRFTTGDNEDLQLLHNGTDSRIINNGSDLFIYTVGDHDVKILADSQNAVICKPDAAVELYYDNSKKLETFASGVQVTGRIEIPDGSGYGLRIGDSADLQIYHSGSHSFIDDTGTGDMYIRGDNSLKIQNAAGSEQKIVAISNGSVEIYYDHVKQLQTTANGIGFVNNCTFSDDKKIQMGGGNDLQIYHDGTDSFIKNTTGHLKIGDANVRIMNAACDEDMIHAKQNEQVELYYDNSKKFETTSTGVAITGNITASGGQLTLENGNEEQIHRFWSNTSDSDIYGLLSGSTFGTIVEGSNNGHHVIALRGNDTSDSFAIVSGGGNYQTDSTYDTLVARFYSNGIFHMPDNNQIKLGTGNDLKIFFDGTHSKIDHTPATGSLFLAGDSLVLANSGMSEYYLTAAENGAVQLNYDNSLKLATFSGGISVTGQVNSDGSHMGDNDVAMFGDSNDLQIKHDGNNSKIVHSGGGNLVIEAAGSDEDVTIQATDDVFIKVQSNEHAIRCLGDAGVELYFNNSKKLETTSTGTTTTGQSKVDVDTNLNSATEYNGQDFGFLVSYDGGHNPNDEGNGICFAQHYYDQDAATIRTGAIIGYKTSGNGSFGGGLKFKVQDSGANPLKEMLRMKNDRVDIPQDTSLYIGANHDLRLVHDGSDSTISNQTGVFFIQNTGDLRLRVDDDDAAVHCVRNGQTALYYDNSLKLDTRSGGVGISGDLFFVDSTRIYMGSSNDFQLFHDGTNTHIVNTTGNLVYRSDTHHFKDKDNSDTHAKFVHDGAVELYYDNSKKLETISDGVEVTGDFKTSTARGYTVDIQEGINGSASSVTLEFVTGSNGRTAFVEMFVGTSNYHLHHVSHRYYTGSLNVLTNDGTGCTVSSSVSGAGNNNITYTYTVTFDDSTSHPYARFRVSVGGYILAPITSASISFG